MAATTDKLGLQSLLTESELEVLELLARGHTVKSIASSLGRSEASINERLRDARRKAGIGSSRELARLLAAQKTWDRKIDLSGDDRSTDDGARSPPNGGSLSKGLIIMLLTLPIAAAAALFMAADGLPVSQAEYVAEARQSPLVGTWSLDVARIPEDERPQDVTIAFRVTREGKWATRIDMTGPDGVKRFAESVAAPDGVPVAITGTMPFIDSGSIRNPAVNTLVLTLAKNGAPVSTRVYAVSKDRKTMTETIIWPGEGVPRLETTYFSRVG